MKLALKIIRDLMEQKLASGGFFYVCWNKNARSNFDKLFLMMNEFLVIIHLQY